jgi:2-C-methyl-D-erythritol 2,4-cyclodiphosphate synthase
MNIDATVIAQAPKLASHIPEICKQIASILGLDISQVNIKAKTAEKLGPVGQGMSIEAQAMVLVQHVS